MKVLLAGDSWGVGVWQKPRVMIKTIFLRNNKTVWPGVIHKGLEYFLSLKNHDVTNISFGGATNLQIYESLLSQNLKQYDYIFVYYTNPLRDICIDFEIGNCKLNRDFVNQIPSLIPYFDAKDRSLVLSDFYSIIDILADNYKEKIKNLMSDKPIYYIGGQCKIPEFHSGDKIKTLFPSLREYFYPTFVQHKVLGMCEYILPIELLSKFNLETLDELEIQYNCFRNLPNTQKEYFYPDGYHLNLKGHKILADYLHDFMTQ